MQIQKLWFVIRTQKKGEGGEKEGRRKEGEKSRMHKENICIGGQKRNRKEKAQGTRIKKKTPTAVN